MRLRKVLRRLVPFKGTWFWEMQVGPLVLQWRHTALPADSCAPGPRITCWHDTFWRR